MKLYEYTVLYVWDFALFWTGHKIVPGLRGNKKGQLIVKSGFGGYKVRVNDVVGPYHLATLLLFRGHWGELTKT